LGDALSVFARDLLNLKREISAGTAGSWQAVSRPNGLSRPAKDKLDIASASNETLQSRTIVLYDDEIQANPAIANLVRHSRQDGWRIQSGREVLCEAALNMARICRAGAFRPIAAEAGFGPGDKQVRIELKNEEGTPILLCGSIDRIDAARIGEKTVAVVFDYKTRDRSINWSHLADRSICSRRSI
jgi:hypothetical protein